MNIIAIEGPSRVGKETQSKFLVQNLNDLGFKAFRLSFPMYDTPIGNLIYSMLHSDQKIDELTIHYLLETDRAQIQTKLNQFEKTDIDFVIIDRYLMTGVVYGMVCRGYDPSFCEDLQSVFYKPKLNIVIDLDPKVALERVNKEKGDYYEEQLDLQEQLRNTFLTLAKSPVYISEIVNGAVSAEDLGNSILEIVGRYFLQVNRQRNKSIL